MEVLLLMTRTQNSRLIVSEPDRVARRRHSDDVLNFPNVKLNREEPRASDLRYAGDGSQTAGLSRGLRTDVRQISPERLRRGSAKAAGGLHAGAGCGRPPAACVSTSNI